MQAVASSATAMQAVASSATAMQAVAVSPVAIAAIYRSDVALSAVDSEVSAAATFYGADSVAMGKAVVILAGLDPAGYADMSAVAANYVALVALYSNAEALSIAQGTTVGAAALAGAGSVATGKAAVKLAGLDPDDFADMAAVAASSTAMAAVAAAWETTESIIASSSVALNALKNSGKCETIKEDVSGAKSVPFYSGLCFVFTAQITVSGDQCVIKATRPTGSSTLTLCSSVTTTTVNKFCKDPYVQCTDSGHSYANNYLYCYKI